MKQSVHSRRFHISSHSHPTKCLWAVHLLPELQQWCSANTKFTVTTHLFITIITIIAFRFFLFKSVNGKLSCLWQHQWSSNLNSCAALKTDRHEYIYYYTDWLACLIFCAFNRQTYISSAWSGPKTKTNEITFLLITNPNHWFSNVSII